MILVDVNLLVEATMTSASKHDAARSWLQEQLSGTARVGLPWVCITGFVRVVGQSRAWERPMPVQDALAVVRSWLARPCAWIPEPGPRHIDLLEELLQAQPSVRLVTDAYLAAIAMEQRTRAVQSRSRLCSLGESWVAITRSVGLTGRRPSAGLPGRSSAAKRR